MKINSLLETITPSSAPNREGGQAPVFGRSDKFLEEKDKVEETTVAGNVGGGAPTDMGMQRRAKGSIFSGIKTSEKFPNSKAVKEYRDMCNVCGQTPCNCTHITEGAYEDGVRDGMQGTPNRRASSIYGPSTTEYEKGYTAGVQQGKEQQQSRLAQAQSDEAPYEQMSDKELIQLRKEIQQRTQERQKIYQKLRGSDYSFDYKRHTPPNHKELKQQGAADNKSWNIINQVLGQRGVDIHSLEEGIGQDMAKLGGIAAVGIGAGLAGNYYDQQQPRVNVGGQKAYLIQHPGWGKVPDNAMTLQGKDGKTYTVWASKGKGSTQYYATPAEKVKEGSLNESPAIDLIRSLISEFNTEMSGSPYYPMDYKNPGMRMWTRGDGSRYKDPGYIFIERDLKPEDQPKWHKAKAVEKFWKFIESKGARKIGDVSGEFGSDPHSPAVVLNKLIFVFNGRSIAWGSTSRLKNSSVWRQKQQGVNEVSDETLISYLTKVDADAQKHEKDPTKRSAEKRNKSVTGFSRAFNKLDARKGVAEETIHVGYRNSSGDWIKTTTHDNYRDAKAAMERLVKRGKKGVQHRYDNKGNIDPGAMMTARPDSGVAEDGVESWAGNPSDRRHPGHESYMTPEYMLAHYKKRLAQIAVGKHKYPKEVAQLQAKIAKLENPSVAEEKCPECGGPMFSEMIMNEKKDACYYKVKSRYKVWPSAYASGALVKCRKKGADSWGNKSKNEDVAEDLDANQKRVGQLGPTEKITKNNPLRGKLVGASESVEHHSTDEQLDENLRDWFKEKWVRFGPDGKIRGACARGDDSEGKPKCLPQSKAHRLGKKGRASAAARKRREDPNPERSGKAINVNTKKKTNEEQLDELKCWPGYTRVRGVPAGAPGSCKKKTSEDVAEALNDNKAAGQAIQSLKNLAIMKPTLSYQELARVGKDLIIDNAIKACIQLEHSYKSGDQLGNAIFVRALRDEIDNFKKGILADLSDLLQGRISKVSFQQGVAEGAKVDRMVKHIAKSERSLGKSKKEAENIAWATVNKRGYLDNKNKKAHESIEESELTEEQLLVKKLQQELELFKKALDKELSNKPDDKEVQKKKVDEILGFQIGRKPNAVRGDGPPTLGAQAVKHAPRAEDEEYTKFNKQTGDTEFFVVHRVGSTYYVYKKNAPGVATKDKLVPTGIEFKSPPESAHYWMTGHGFKWFNQEWWKA